MFSKNEWNTWSGKRLISGMPMKTWHPIDSWAAEKLAELRYRDRDVSVAVVDLMRAGVHSLRLDEVTPTLISVLVAGLDALQANDPRDVMVFLFEPTPGDVKIRLEDVEGLDAIAGARLLLRNLYERMVEELPATIMP